MLNPRPDAPLDNNTDLGARGMSSSERARVLVPELPRRSRPSPPPGVLETEVRDTVPLVMIRSSLVAEPRVMWEWWDWVGVGVTGWGDGFDGGGVAIRLKSVC